MEGILVINKPQEWTSHDCVAVCRRATGVKRVGHGGTLDPMAEGVLPVFIGRATRIMEYMDLGCKTYRCCMRLGIVTDTEDIWGEILEERSTEGITEDQIRQTAESFCGDILQKPPMYSALKIKGRKLYEYARQGITLEIQPRSVRIENLEIEEIDLKRKEVLFEVTCSKGTYIRTLCADIGEALGCGGCMQALRRTQAGEYTIAEAVPLQQLLEAAEPETYLRDVDTMFRGYPAVKLTVNQEKRCRNGNAFSVSLPGGTYRAYSQSGEFLMLAKVEDGVMSTIKSFFDVQ